MTLTADASDVVGTVASVSFYNGGTLIGTDDHRAVFVHVDECGGGSV